ncbi:protein kinase domain-containing protein [Hyalangium versicolor]|uniref:protein kinase domain-containing protein n=1 Tax=Hyalangium versicolor TaxID=2861190 RepID=UPI001CC9E413|nr:protein kinase [Hyalangium versicolor]
MSKDDPTWDIPAARKSGSGSGLDSTLPGRTATSQAAAQALPLVQLDRYDISGEFAHGAIGRILQARDRHLGRPVAIKELITRGGEVEARFVAEALITARLQHPSIVPVYEAGRWATGEPFFAMKFVKGRSLADVISEKRTLQERLALLPHVLAVAEAIAYSHTERIIHRDLKPANVLVGAFGETVVIDWGLAKDLTQDTSDEATLPVTPKGADPSLTQLGMVVGTPAYMPPEQAAGRPVDERADVYALGAILYHLLAGTRPYDSGSSAQVIDQVVRGPPLALNQRQKGIPADLLAIVAKAMARDPAERYATARELAEDLRRFQTGQIVGAHAYSLGERFWRWVRRYRAVVSVTAVALLILAVMGTAGVLRVMAERDRAEAAQLQTLQRADELTLLHARTAMERDPNETLTWLGKLSPGFNQWSAVRTIAADARARGFATILRGHKEIVTDLVFSHDGRFLITCSDDHTVRVWNMERDEARVLTGHTDEVWHMALTPDGKHVATTSKDRTVRLWNLETGEGRILATHPGPADSIAFTPDGLRMVSTNRGDDMLRVWNVATGALEKMFKTGLGNLNMMEMSPNGRYVIVKPLEGPRAQLWDLEQGTSRTLEHGSTVVTLAFSPRGDKVATGSMNQTLRLWDPRTGQEQILGEQLGSLSYLAFSPDGMQLATGNAEGQVRLWNLNTGKSELLGTHEGRVNEILFFRDGHLLATSSDDRTAQLWDLTTGHSRVLRGHQGAVYPLDFSPDGKWLAVGSYDGTTRLFSVRPEANRLLAKSLVFLSAMAVAPGGQQVAAAGGDFLQLINVSTEASVTLEAPHLNEPITLQFSPDARWLATGGKDGLVRLWDATTGKLVHKLEGHANPTTALTFSRDGQRLATADASGEVRLWEVGSGKGRALGLHEEPVLALAFSPDGQKLASGSKAGKLRLWRLGEGSVEELRGHEDAVRSLLFSPDGRRLISGSMDHTVRIWDLDTGQSKRADASGNGVRKVVMSADGKLLISSSEKDSTLRLWDGWTAEAHGVLKGHQGDISDFALSPDGRRVVSASLDRTVRLFDLETNESRVMRGHAARVTGVAFLDDQHMASVSWDGSVRYWSDDLPTDPVELRQWMESIETGRGTNR